MDCCSYRKCALGGLIVGILLCLSGWVSAPLGLILGALLGFTLGNPWEKQTHAWMHRLLKISIVGMGFGINVETALAVGREGFGLTVTSLALVFFIGICVGKLLRMDKKTVCLVSSGTAICGGSAIAAVAPAIDADEKSISGAMGVVFLLNSIALLLFPVLGHALEMTAPHFGMWCAIAIHDTSSVVGAASAYGDEALKVATTVKLARALWIIPLAFVMAFIFRSKNRKVKIPWFIAYFVLAILCSSYLPIPEIVTSKVVHISKSLLIVALFFVGAGLSVAKLKALGWKPLWLGLILWASISVFALWAIEFRG